MFVCLEFFKDSALVIVFRLSMACLPVSGLVVVVLILSVGVLSMVGMFGIIGSEVVISTWSCLPSLSWLSLLIKICVSVTLSIFIIDWEKSSVCSLFEVVSSMYPD